MKTPTTDPASLRRLLSQSSRASTPPALGECGQGDDSPTGNRSTTSVPSMNHGLYFSSPSGRSASSSESRAALLRVLTCALELIDDEDLDEEDTM
jgi:hypothetical protein